MAQATADFIAHRVAALAYVALTRRPDVSLTELGQSGELDLLAYVRGGSGRQMRCFGVVLKGTSRPLTEADASRDLRTHFRLTDKERGPVLYPFPVLAVTFSMEDDVGYFDWRAKPVTSGGAAMLETTTSFDCRRFTKRELDAIVGEVNDWYDRLFASIHALPA